MDKNVLSPRLNDDGSYTMCSKNGCCPTVKFDENGGAVISDEGQEVAFSPEQFRMFTRLLKVRFG